MRRASFVVLFGVVAACTEPDTRAIPVEVKWMEWPAEVLAATPFSIRISGWGPGCYRTLEFRAPVTTDQSSVTVEPYYLVDGDDHNVICTRDLTAQVRFDLGYYDTRVPVPGLTPPFPRSYEIRAPAVVGLRSATTPDRHLPSRTFGEVMVRSDSADATRLNAGGEVYTTRDSLGCLRINPAFYYPGYVVENPPDTATYWSGFVRGYLYKAAAPLCGETRVFHLESRN